MATQKWIKKVFFEDMTKNMSKPRVSKKSEKVKVFG